MKLPDPFCHLIQTDSAKNPPHGWAVHFASGTVPLYTREQMIAYRKQVLEEAAKVGDDVDHEYGEGWVEAAICAKRIRALIDKGE
jgi:hypothetical protein